MAIVKKIDDPRAPGGVYIDDLCFANVPPEEIQRRMEVGRRIAAKIMQRAWEREQAKKGTDEGA